jgi:hypothetical protein
MGFHGVLKLLALKVVHYLIRRGLPDIQYGLVQKVMRFDLVTHRVLPVPGRPDWLPER